MIELAKQVHRRCIRIRLLMYNAALAFFFAAFSACGPADTFELHSPGEEYTFTLDATDSGMYYRVWYESSEIIGPSLLGLVLAGEGEVPAGNTVRVLNERDVNDSWQPIYGERSTYPNNYREAVIAFTPEDEDNPAIRLIVRAYDEGLAFRYHIEEQGRTVVASERTQFVMSPEATAWTSVRAQHVIEEGRLGALPSEAVERPLLAQYDDSLFVAVGEAALVNFARMKFLPDSVMPGRLYAQLDGEVVFDSAFYTPWRYIMAGKTAGDLLEHNYLLLNLNEPSQIENTQWIKPGKVIREVTLTTQGGMACVDFAADHNLQYIEFDAGWYGNEYDSASDATTVTVDPGRSSGPLDLLQVIDYGKSKGIGVWLYVNRRALEQQLDEVLPLARSWGVAGLKYGFVQFGPQRWTSWVHEAVRKAAAHQLMVDIHDEYRPTGYSRTYPNLMTQEGIRGDESSPDNTMVLKTLFTRMLAGAGDQTNCYFASRVEEKMGSHASQLAKVVCIYSPIQFLFWYDRPPGAPAGVGGAGKVTSYIQDVPEMVFFEEVPTVWDDTKVIEGYPGKYVSIARKKGEKWYLGSIAGCEPYNLSVKLDFLDKNTTYAAKIFSDDVSINTRTNVRIREINVTHESVLNHHIVKQNGLAAILTPVK